MSDRVEKQDFKKYLGEARSWEIDRVQKAVRSKRLAWFIAGIASIVALGNSATSAVLATREPDPPVVVRVNESTGTTEVVSRLRGGETTYDEVTNKYWVERYIVAREGYLMATADENYNAVGLMSCASEARKYGDWFSPRNPASPLNLYRETAKVKINIKGTSLIKANVALTRFTKEVERPGQDKPDVTHWAATTVFKYSGAPMKEKDRRVNPLGYQTCEFRLDADAASGEARSIAAMPAASQEPAPATAAGVVLFPGVGPMQAGPQVPAIVRGNE